MRLNRLLTVVAAMAMSVAGHAMAAEVYSDVGSKDDFDKAQNLYFDKEGGFGGTGWPMYWNRPIVEDDHLIYWATTPAPAPGQITERVICFGHFARFRVKAADLPQDKPLYLTVRYKDDILPGSNKEGAPVYAWNGGSKWVLLGTLGGKRDHQWKTTQLAVAADQRTIEEGHYIFKIGDNRYTASIIGELPLDKIKLSDGKGTAEFGPDAPGLWPKTPPSRFANLSQTRVFEPGGKPFFPFGIWVSAPGRFIDGATPTQAGRGPLDMWQICQDVRMNSIVFNGWDQNWGSKWHVSNPYKWLPEGHYLEAGFKENLFQTREHNMKVFQCFITDTRSYWIRRPEYHMNGEDGLLKRIADVGKTYGDDPGLGALFPVDEWDHEDQSYGKPQGFSHLIYDTLLRSAPDRPRMITAMGFKDPKMWRLMSEEAEIMGEDVYLNDYGGTEPGLKKQAERLDQMRANVRPGGLIMMIADCFDRKPQDEQSIVAEAYLGITHGAGALIYFSFHHPEDPKTPPGVWAGLRRVGNELFGPDGIAPALLPPATQEDLMGESGLVKVTGGPALHFALRRLEGKRYLFVLNGSSQPVAAHMAVKGLEKGMEVTTRFDKRTIAVGDDGFEDKIEPFGRRVYLFPAP